MAHDALPWHWHIGRALSAATVAPVARTGPGWPPNSRAPLRLSLVLLLLQPTFALIVELAQSEFHAKPLLLIIEELLYEYFT
mmetsp:Transcript_15391/g.42950  ORF Transcript_15391/g.42950 Transcript_15391/m.42950 type:complete len:82 (+) Transcript_15391:1164-1409(+)